MPLGLLTINHSSVDLLRISRRIHDPEQASAGERFDRFTRVIRVRAQALLRSPPGGGRGAAEKMNLAGAQDVDNRRIAHIHRNSGNPRQGQVAPPARADAFTKGSRGTTNEVAALLKPDAEPKPQLTQRSDGWYLELTLDPAWASEQPRQLVTTERLGRAKVPDLPFEHADGSPVRLDKDYLGRARNADNPFPGPIEAREGGRQSFKVWPLEEK